MKKSDQERLKKIVSIWEEVQTQILDKNISREALLTDSFLQWAMTTPLYNIGEQVYRISGELKKAHPDIPWSKIAGLRHRLVHDYEGINWTIIVDVLFEEMDPAVQSMKGLIRTEEQI